MTAVRTAVLFDPASPVHRLSEPDMTACHKPVPDGAVTTPQRDALLSAEVHGIEVCGHCYPDRTGRWELARRSGVG